MNKIFKLTESQLKNIIQKILNEQTQTNKIQSAKEILDYYKGKTFINSGHLYFDFVYQKKDIKFDFFGDNITINEGSFFPTELGTGTYTIDNNVLIINVNSDIWRSDTGKWQKNTLPTPMLKTENNKPATQQNDKTQINNQKANVETTQKFQQFLDKNYAGWHNGNILGTDVQNGYGTFGPRTQQMWNIKKIKDEFTAQNK